MTCFRWLELGMSLGVASVQRLAVPFSTKCAPRLTVKEMQHKVAQAVPDTRYHSGFILSKFLPRVYCLNR